MIPDPVVARLVCRFFVCFALVACSSCSDEVEPVSSGHRDAGEARTKLLGVHYEVFGGVLDYLAKQDDLTPVLILSDTAPPLFWDWDDSAGPSLRSHLERYRVAPELVRDFRELNRSTALVEEEPLTRSACRVVPASEFLREEGFQWQLIHSQTPKPAAILCFSIPAVDSEETAAMVHVFVGEGPATGWGVLLILEKKKEGWIVRKPSPRDSRESASEPGDEATSLDCTYDAWNRLVSVTEGETTVTYEYDGLNRRIERVAGGTARHYYYDGRQVVETRLPDGQGGLDPEHQYVWSLRYVDSPILRDSYAGGQLVPGDRLYYLTDANHNVTAVTDAAGAVQERYDYDAYGKVTIYAAAWANPGVTSAVGNTRLFAGQDVDPATGLQYAGARWYNTSTGGFVSRDPLGLAAGDVNLYRYVGNNPVIYVDPTGLYGVMGRGAIGAVSGAAAGVAVGFAAGGIMGGPPGAAAGAVAGGIRGGVCGFIAAAYMSPKDTFGDLAAAGLGQGVIAGVFSGIFSGAAAAKAAQAAAAEAGAGAATAEGTSLAGRIANFLRSETGAARIPGEAPTKVLVRYGSPDSVARLAADAARAEAKIGHHGVSAILRKPPKFPHGQANFEEASKVFQIIQTGTNKSHYTVVLPKPVTRAVADLFNSVFRLVGG